MAAVALLRTLASTVDGTSATTAAFTPTAGSLMVAIVAARGTVINPGVVSTSDGMTFTLARRVLWGTNAHIISAYVADAASVANSQTLNFNSGADNYSNVCISVHEITGMEKFGLDAVLQSGAQANGASGGTPTVVFSAPANTNNPVMFGVAVAANPAGLTEPNGFTATVNIGAALPDSGLHVSHVDSGFTSDTVAAGSTAASVYGALALEFDAPVAAAPEPEARLADAYGAARDWRALGDAEYLIHKSGPTKKEYEQKLDDAKRDEGPTNEPPQWLQDFVEEEYDYRTHFAAMDIILARMERNIRLVTEAWLRAEFEKRDEEEAAYLLLLN